MPTTDDARLRGGETSERCDRALGSIFLKEADQGVRHDDREDGGGVDRLADRDGDGRRPDQHPDDDAAELRGQDVEPGDLASRAEHVRAARAEPPARLVGAQPSGGVAHDRGEDVLRRSGMPGVRHR